MRKDPRNDDAFTGLEAAIVLIAFVVVAAVFSYVVLGAGFFTTQKSQEVVHSGVTQAASNIIVKGEVYGIADSTTTPTAIDLLRFDVGLAAGGVPVDVNKTVIVFSKADGTVKTLVKDNTDYTKALTAGGNTTAPGENHWHIAEIRPLNHPENDLLFTDTSMTLVVNVTNLKPRDAFNLEIKPEIGASLGVQRTVPPSVTAVTLLY